MAELDLLENPEFSADERFYQDLWKKYFTRIAVEERLNPKLQGQNMPLKYRRYLVELD
jgi:probable DNA metabolism protein